jgi:hypothetical protein
MTLLQLIAHLKEAFETHGEMEALIIRPESCGNCVYLANLGPEDVEVDPAAKTITFT